MECNVTFNCGYFGRRANVKCYHSCHIVITGIASVLPYMPITRSWIWETRSNRSATQKPSSTCWTRTNDATGAVSSRPRCPTGSTFARSTLDDIDFRDSVITVNLWAFVATPILAPSLGPTLDQMNIVRSRCTQGICIGTMSQNARQKRHLISGIISFSVKWGIEASTIFQTLSGRNKR